MNEPVQRVVTAMIEARARTRALVDDLDDAQMNVPPLEIVNPVLWEIGHVAWFHEKWLLRHRRGRDSLRADADRLFDSAAVAHDSRWSLPLYSRTEILRYMEDVQEGVLEALTGSPAEEDLYFARLALAHEDMHGEALTYTRQTLGYREPVAGAASSSVDEDVRDVEDVAGTAAATVSPGDVEFPGGEFLLGADPREPFVFDNEKWAHPVQVAPFAIARLPVTEFEFLEFIEAGGYTRREWWSDAGWSWREQEAAEHPVYWRRDGRTWLRRSFHRWVPLEANTPVQHVCWFEAEAYCRFAGRRLPTEAEWERAASCPPHDAAARRRYPWGDSCAGAAVLDAEHVGCRDVHCAEQGASAGGCRHMIGNVWEWTDTWFHAYPGFVVDPYKEYSAPWFGDHRVLRGGCWATRRRLIRNTWRNFYRPYRRDVFAGFRTCAR